MWDSQYNSKSGLGCACTGATGLAGCDHQRARASQAEQHFNTLPGRINEVKNKIKSLETGTLQAEYVALEEQQANRRKRIAELDNEITKATTIRDMWLQNPEVAAATGMGFIKKLWNKAFSCDTYTNREKDFKNRSLPLEKEFAAEQKKMEILQTKFADANMNLIRVEAQRLNNEVAIREKKLAEILAEIENIKAAYNARKEAERLALEQQAQEAKKAAELVEAQKAKPKQGNSLMIFGLLGAIALGAYFFKGNKKTVKVSV